ncbi:MAG TPA: efflux transporter outer membrane subunit [Ideonella sp.]|uniref:efflux transporter outer membrane subunit n=1 Tax=Ideonella sp. TaxID=1929293 RepID=UPI002E37310A|nr:efflux transporter outer membrane subunit [Ideonella sp.]HEX5687415.1 efflux transporter outer membrane subunit [Ideonella sp.]
MPLPPFPSYPPAWLGAALCATLNLLGGCASAPPAPTLAQGIAAAALGQWARVDILPGAAAPDARALATWWQQFGDPHLDRLMQQALAGNLDLRSARATLRQAQAARAAAEAGTGPLLGISAGASRSLTRSSTSNLYKLGFSASWEPDLNGSQASGVAAADADAQAAWADLGTTRMTLSAELGLAYVQWRGAQARLRITAASLASLEQTLELARWKAQAGLASVLDVEQARLSVEQTRASLPSLATEIAQDEHLIALLTGRAPSELMADLPAQPLSTNGVPQAGPAMERLAVGLPADLLRRRPDLQAAEARVRAAWARQEQTRRAGWPGLGLSGSVGLQALTLGALGQASAGVAALAASVDWTLFDNGLRRAQVDQAGAALDSSRIAYDAAVLGAVRDVEDSLVALRGSRDRAESLRQAADAAAATLHWTRVRHDAGLTDFATLLEAQRNELGALLALQTTQTDLSLNLIRLFKALGGGWDADAANAEPVPTPTPNPSPNAPPAPAASPRA